MQPTTPWTATTYRRYSVDIHVPDGRPELLSHFDAATYIDSMVRAGVQSLLQYTNSHVGLALWRTKVGQMHANMGEHDFFGEVVAECRRRGIHPLAYFSVIFDNWAYEYHPDWRMSRFDGYETTLQGRYGLVCPNSPYRDYVVACIQEIASTYEIDGMFFDMTFWPHICYCPHCTTRFLREHGTEPPRVVDWDDPTWRAFQQARQSWLLEFAQLCRESVRQTRPGTTVNHQFSTIFNNWTYAVPLELTDACDYVGGDFYGGATQHSLACKVYEGITHTRPFEFHTSRTRHFRDHVTVKPMEEIRTEAFVATLHSAALMLVDYINADGTLNHDVYDFLGRLSAQRAAYEPFLGGNLVADIAVYYDKQSMYNPEEQGVSVSQLQAVDYCPHRDAVLGAARILQRAHIPFGVVTNISLDQLDRYRAVIVPSVLEMTADQAQLFRAFVEQGGVLYASGVSSLDRFDPTGPRFLLEDVLGVRYTGTIGTRITYMSPHDPTLRSTIWPQDHLSHGAPAPVSSTMARLVAATGGTAIKAEALPGTEVLCTVTLPFLPPEPGRVIGSHFSAIHSDPPALQPGTDPAVVIHPYGKGVAVWVAAPVESGAEEVHSKFMRSLLQRVLPGPFRFEAETHPAVEVTVFEQRERQRLLVGLLNLQQQPQVPVGAALRVQIPDAASVARVLRLPECQPVPFDTMGRYVQFHVAPFDAFAMLAVELS